MTTLNNIPEESGPVHLLLIAPSKAGKSTYVAEAAISGFHLVYVDADNGLSAMRARLGKEANRAEIEQRVHYFGTNQPKLFMKSFLTSRAKKPMVWVPSLNKLWTERMGEPDIQPDTPVLILNIKAMPAHYILTLDSWTALAQDALGQLRPEQTAPLLDGTDQSIYGDAKANADFICNMIQSVPCHVVVQAHDSRYEIYDKPKGVQGKDMKQGVMTLLETIQVPISTSRPSGLEMGKRFNHIGWLEVASTGTVDIDFTRKSTRLGGGPPNRKDKTTNLTFLKLVQESGGPLPGPKDDSWCIEITHAEVAKTLKGMEVK